MRACVLVNFRLVSSGLGSLPGGWGGNTVRLQRLRALGLDFACRIWASGVRV